jgi:hypothetical protein
VETARLGCLPRKARLSESLYIVILPRLTVFAVQQIAHGFAAGGVGAFVGLERVAGRLPVGFFFAAVGATIGESGLAGLEFEFLSAGYAGFDGIRHLLMILGRRMASFASWLRTLAIARRPGKLTRNLAAIQIFDDLFWVIHVRIHADRTS